MRAAFVVFQRLAARHGRACQFARPRAVRSIVLLVFAAIVLSGQSVQADTLPDALVWTYQNNPQLNAERARQRATDEGVPQALAAYRPQIAAALSAGLLAVRNLFPDNTVQSQTLRAWSAGVTVNQTIVNGNKTANSVRQAESQVLSGQEALRGIEQSVFLDVVAAYTNVYSAQSLVESQRTSVTLLRETLESTRRRYDAGDVTPTDVAQAEARQSRGLADLNAAEVSLAVAKGTYMQVVGVAPKQLTPGEPIDRILPANHEQLLSAARREHPSIVGATYDVDVAQAAIKVAESGLYPTVTLQGSLSRNVGTDTTFGTSRSDIASIVGQGNIPLYDGGLASSQIRQAKELLSQVRVQLDRARIQIDTAVAAAWATNDGARVAVSASEAEVRAAALALEGVQREARAGQRTTLDVLNSLQDLTAARARLILAQRDRVVASYTLLAAIGRLDHQRLGLATVSYDPAVHYHQVRDAWHGIRTPSGQ
jgi:outer membrane protein